jgi:molybdopterin-guanine dinucleotide biosynthesis protein
MITARTTAFTSLARRLANHARIAAEAHAENALRTQAKDPWRWRKARLLWPGSTQES